MDAVRDRRRSAATPGTAATAVALDGVTIALGGKTILADVSVTIAPVEFIGVLGPNGAGKTTLMRTVLGLITPLSGKITVLGHAARRGNPSIGYLAQTRGAPATSRLTAYDFLASSVHGERWGVPLPSRGDAREIDRVLDLVGGSELAGRPLGTLSGGERQRLLLAQALIGQPTLLLLDEPLISLDPRQQQVVIDLIRRLSRELHLTVLFSAHELNQLLPVIDRVLYLGNGHAALGTVDEVVTPAMLSRLYGAPIEVVRAQGHIFVLSNGQEVETHHHDHPHHDHHHGAGDHDHARV